MSESLDEFRKRIAFRCRQRGMLETSLLLRQFAEIRLSDLSQEELRYFERILDANDNELLDWIVGRRVPPADIDRKILELIKNYKTSSA